MKKAILFTFLATLCAIPYAEATKEFLISEDFDPNAHSIIVATQHVRQFNNRCFIQLELDPLPMPEVGDPAIAFPIQDASPQTRVAALIVRNDYVGDTIQMLEEYYRQHRFKKDSPVPETVEREKLWESFSDDILEIRNTSNKTLKRSDTSFCLKPSSVK